MIMWLTFRFHENEKEALKKKRVGEGQKKSSRMWALESTAP